MSKLTMQEEGSAPSTPSTGKWIAYFKSDGWYIKDDAGNEIGPMHVAASATVSGIVELATIAEALAGTDVVRAVTPAGLYLPPGYLYGLTLSNNGSDATNDIDIATGKCRDSTDAANMVLASALTKRLDAAWAVGTNQGGLDTGSIANATYHVWLIKRSDTGVVDALFSTSATTPTMPANYDYKRRIGSILRESAAIVAFFQDGDYFRRKATILDVNVTNPGTSAVSRALSVPLGINVMARINLRATAGATTAYNAFVSDLDANDEAPSGTAAPLGSVNVLTNWSQNVQLEVRTNTSAQVRVRQNASDAESVLKIATLGWWDRRGRS